MVSLICPVYLFLVGFCLISSNNQEILSLLIVVLYTNWTLDYLIGFLESDCGVVATCPASLQRVWRVTTGQTSLQRFVSALEEIRRICEEYACDLVQSCSCVPRRWSSAWQEGKRQGSQFISHLLLGFSSLSDFCFSVFVSQGAKQVELRQF